MPSLFCEIPTKQEVFSVAAVRLTDEQIGIVAREVVDNASVYYESPANKGGPRKWPSYEAFLGFHIANAALRYRLEGEQLQKLVATVYDRQMMACMQDREDREGCWPAS